MESSGCAPSADEENKMDLLKKGACRPAHYKKKKKEKKEKKDKSVKLLDVCKKEEANAYV